MKRYRVLRFSFDSRSSLLTQEICVDWAEDIQRQHIENRNQQIAALQKEYGELLAEQKIANFADLGDNPFSIVSYHTAFLEQIRHAFVGFAYYPALTGACALGERILNHLVLRLREYYTDRPEYKRLYRKASFDDWKSAINALEAWGVLLPNVARAFRALQDARNAAIHFSPDLEQDQRGPALVAIRLVKEIVADQFSAFGTQPWFIPAVPGESYIKKEAEAWPFVREFYLPACVHVSPYHRVLEIDEQGTWRIGDCECCERGISDEEYVALLHSRPQIG